MLLCQLFLKDIMVSSPQIYWSPKCVTSSFRLLRYFLTHAKMDDRLNTDRIQDTWELTEVTVHRKGEGFNGTIV
jgi:hypothetical protein